MDFGRTGITYEVAHTLVTKLASHGKVYISSERQLEPELDRYRIPIDPSEIHHALYYADLYIGDSQTMAAESAVLGTPSIRFNDFVGRLGYLEDLEHRHRLTCGIGASEPDKLFAKVDEFLNQPYLKVIWHRRRQTMLTKSIDLTAFMSWLFGNYPKSIQIVRDDPDFQRRFQLMAV